MSFVALDEFRSALNTASGYMQRGDYKAALRLLTAVYAQPGTEAPPDGRSLYGFCLAVAGRKVAEGVEQCRLAIDLQPYDAAHHVNLIKLFLAIGSRRRAVEALEQALRAFPDDALLLKTRETMRYRRAHPVIPFLHRDNPLNIWLGRKSNRRS
jgi:tetratricopeptide (TPR) repeat protein